MLLALSDNYDFQIDEVKRLQTWQVQKLKKQASLFSREILVLNYRKLFEIDKAAKTGKATIPLSSAIDIWLLKL